MFTTILLNWFAAHGRTLPWRGSKDPYAIWLSEVILQQTRIAQGTDYYLRFMAKWPTVEQLAAASEDEVLRQWQGLGYYSRARNLHAAARAIAARGAFPDTYEEIRKLKGVGDYTAAAIASMAFGLPYAAVDGNVYRVLARYYGIDTAINSSQGKKLFQSLANSLCPQQAAGTWNQALMDFGALQCTPTSPDCTQCPLCESCQAYRQGLVYDLPIKAKHTAIGERHLLYLFIHDGERMLLERRPAGDIWQGLYQPLLVEYQQPTPEAAMLADIHKVLRQSKGMAIQTPALQFRHVLTHRILHLTCYAIHCPTLPHLGNMQPVPFAELDNYAMPRAILKAMEQLRIGR